MTRSRARAHLPRTNGKPAFARRADPWQAIKDELAALRRQVVSVLYETATTPDQVAAYGALIQLRICMPVGRAAHLALVALLHGAPTWMVAQAMAARSVMAVP